MYKQGETVWIYKDPVQKTRPIQGTITVMNKHLYYVRVEDHYHMVFDDMTIGHTKEELEAA